MSTISFNADTLGVAIANAGQSKARLDRLTDQAGSGLIAPTYGGLTRTEAHASLSLQPLLAQQQAVQDGIKAVQGSMNVTQTALQSISRIASDFYAKIPGVSGLASSDVDSIAADARDALRQVAGLLDTQSGGVYVFAGSDGANPPVPDPEQIATSPFATAIGSAVAGLASNGAAATIAGTLAVASPGGVSPFSASLTAGTATPPIVVTGAGQTEPVGVLASGNGSVSSLGTSTTGSYTRDILRALATLGSLSSSQASDTSFQALAQDTYASLGDAITALNADAGVLGDRQSALTQTQTTLSNMSTALTTQLSGAENVDMTTTLSQLTAAQTQLQSSYQLISSLQSLSLTRYLASG